MFNAALISARKAPEGGLRWTVFRVGEPAHRAHTARMLRIHFDNMPGFVGELPLQAMPSRLKNGFVQP